MGSGERGKCVWRKDSHCSVSSNFRLGCRVETSVSTNGAAGVIPATLKYVTEFISQFPEREYVVFLVN